MEANNKLTILNAIFENRNILFAKFSSNITNEDKIKKWQEISKQLADLGIFTKDWKYLRDTTWQNWRKRTLEKRDNRQKTGSKGGKKFKYDDSDELVFKIIGKDSPSIGGFNVPESSGTDGKESAIPKVDDIDIAGPSTMIEINEPVTKKNSQKLVRERTEAPTDLKKQKMEIDIEIAKGKLDIIKKESYKLDLELFKLETELNITQPSSFTLSLHMKNNTVQQENQEQRSGSEDSDTNFDFLQEAMRVLQ